MENRAWTTKQSWDCIGIGSRISAYYEQAPPTPDIRYVPGIYMYMYILVGTSWCQGFGRCLVSV